MTDSNSIIPISDEQAKVIQEALKALQGIGGFLKDTLGTVPQDLVGLLGGDWLKVRRAENVARMLEKARERIRVRRVGASEPPSLSIVLPLLIAAADESRDELQDIWARLLAAATDPARAKSFRIAFIDAVKRMDPLDAAVLQTAQALNVPITNQTRNDLAARVHASRDEIDVSVSNLERLGLVIPTHPPNAAVGPFGREFLRAVSD